MISLTWWEIEELVGWFSSHRKLWYCDEDDPTFWIRYTTVLQEEKAFAVQIIPAVGENRFRQGQLEVVDVEWEESETYMRKLCLRHTSYGDRLEAAEILEKELGLPPAHALVGSLAVAHSFLVGPVLDRLVPPGKQDLAEPGGPWGVMNGIHVGSYGLSGGGFLQLAGFPKSNVIHAKLSLHSSDGPLNTRELEGTFASPEDAPALRRFLYTGIAQGDENDQQPASGSGRPSVPSTGGDGVHGSAVVDETVPELPPAVRMGTSGEPDAGPTEDASGVRVSDPYLPPGTGEGSSDIGSDGEGSGSAAPGLPDSSVRPA